MKQLDTDTQIMLDSLSDSVAKAIDRKLRLGQYAVVWREGKVAYMGTHPQASNLSIKNLEQPPKAISSKQ